MKTDSYWSATASLPRFPKLEKNLTVDVVVIGAGITGITAAYLLRRAGKKVALVERDRCVSGDTVATTAHLTCITDLRLTELAQKFGRDHAAAVWDAGFAAIDLMEELSLATKSDCQFQRVPAYLHASIAGENKDDRTHLEEEADLAAALGFDARFLEQVPLFNRPGMQLASQAKLHPLVYLRSLLEKIPGGGSHVYEHSEVEELTDKPLQVKANSHTISCDYVVIATHVPLMGNNNLVSATLFQSKLAPYSSYVIGAKIPKGLVAPASFFDTSDPYYYLRIDSHRDYDYAIFGGEDHKTGQVSQTESRFERLEAKLREFIPQLEVDHRWSGQVIETNDGLPLMGELGERQFVATGFSGNGTTFGTVAAMMATDHLLGHKNPWSDLFDVHRKKVIGGAWDYIKENLDYPFYLIKDRLLGSAGNDIDAVEPGEGRILQLGGKRVAAFKSDAGKITVLSPVCTHMGCIVHWNTAEKTWDCPCHGSRFKCTGEVIAGPAETPLEKLPGA